MAPAVQALRGEDQIIKRRVMDGGDLGARPVMTRDGQLVEIIEKLGHERLWTCTKRRRR